MITEFRKRTCADGTDDVRKEGIGGTRVVTRNSEYREEIRSYLPGWTGTLFNAVYMFYDHSDIYRDTVWDSRPVIFEYFQFQITGGYLVYSKVNAPGEGISGVDGTVTPYAELIDNQCSVYVSCPPSDRDIICWDIITSCYDEELPDPTAEIVDPLAPEPPVEQNYIEPWDDYTDGDPTVQTLDGGAGWDADWVLTEMALIDGIEPWESYPTIIDEEEIDYTADDYVPLNAEDGWDGAWVFADMSETLGYGDDFEDYVDGAMTPELSVSMSRGEGWENVGTEDIPFYAPWVFGIKDTGGDDFESYEDAVLSVSSVLGYEDGQSWTSAAWTFAED